jgi:nucleoside recognition membrane protein YjiH
MLLFETTGNTASALLANVTTAVQTTFGDLAPIVAVIAGIILAFIVVRYVIGLVKHVGKR